MNLSNSLGSVDAVFAAMENQSYVADQGLATAVFLAAKLGKPLLVEGEPGCGKTEIAKVLAAATGGELIRLQCYEGLDANAALYEWNYAKKLLTIRLHEKDRGRKDVESEIFDERVLLRRALPKGLPPSGPGPPRPLLAQ